jgi:CRISPR/Cas system-associated exonuclease Cas4 (RecB family)
MKMQPLALPQRKERYCHVTWLAPYLAGERHCLFNLHQQVNYCTPSSSGVPGDWVTKHERLLQAVAQSHREEGRIVHLEQENSLRVRSRTGVTIHGQCDVVVSETTDQTGIIADAKTGRPRGKDRAQVLIYMALAPHASALDASDERVEIPAEEAGPAFQKQLAELLQLTVGPVPGVSPSANECRFCRLAEICPNAVTESPAEDSVAWL